MKNIKHNIRITAILLGMFLLTQFIGLYIVDSYTPIQETQIINGTPVNVTLDQNKLPYGLEPPKIQEEVDYFKILPNLIIAFIIAITIILILTKYKWKFLIKAWFFVVITLALAITFNAILLKTSLPYPYLLVLILAIPLGIYKVYKPNFIVHNSTELLTYPGIAAIFVPILNIWTLIILLIIISIYDMWAVWHSGVMQKMAKFQMEELKIFGGFFIPYMSKALRAKIKKIKQLKSEKAKKAKAKNIKVSMAILGGGDVVFPIITAGVFLRAFSLAPALFITAGALAGLAFLFIRSEKKKFYPAMPFITAGMFAGMLLAYIMGFM